jgi:hypothetical protein
MPQDISSFHEPLALYRGLWTAYIFGIDIRNIKNMIQAVCDVPLVKASNQNVGSVCIAIVAKEANFLFSSSSSLDSEKLRAFKSIDKYYGSYSILGYRGKRRGSFYPILLS